MTAVDVAPPPPPAAPDDGGAPPPRRSLARRAGEAYLYGSTPVIIALGFVCALVVGAVLIVIADKPTRTAIGYITSTPSDTFTFGWHAISRAFTSLFEGAIIDPSTIQGTSVSAVFAPISNTLLDATPLITAGLAVALAFRAGLFNIGAQGQLIAGAICAGYAGFAWSLPPVLAVLVAVAGGALGGAVWGGIVGWLKARTGAHEVITTIMLNYVALNLLGYLLSVGGFQRPGSNQAISRIVHGNARLPHIFGSQLPVTLGLPVALLAAVGVWWLLTRSTFGFALRAVGANPAAARTAGMSIAGTTVVVMMLCGALAGLAGSAQVLGQNYALTSDIDAGIGFTAITVALLGQASPFGVVWAGLLFGALQAGAVQMQTDTQLPPEIVQVMQAVIVLFIAAPALIRAIFRLRASRGGGVSQLAKGWNG